MQVGKIEQLTATTPIEQLMERAAPLPPLHHPDGWLHPVPATEFVAVNYQHKFDALYAALYELTDDDTRDAILARAKELEAEQDDE